MARRLFDKFVDRLRASGLIIHVGRFQEHMQVESVNGGPVTILPDSPTVRSPAESSEYSHGSESRQG
jgi:D-tyrosyl-tRNA(Tyr) deacylase